MFLIVGLGNPGRQYEHTRHNAGFDVMDALAEKYNISISESGHKALFGKGMIGGHTLVLLKPSTYMNLSGKAVRYWLDAEKIPRENLLVVVDDIALPFGTFRMRTKGSAGGHNGIKNIIAMTGTENFKRIKVGVGEKPAGWDLADHVLGRMSEEDRAAFEEAVKESVKAVEMILEDEIDQAMNDFNRKKRESQS